MSLFDAINVAATSLEAQSVRLNTVSSNLANANSVSSSEQGTYRAQYPVFETIYNEIASLSGAAAGVHVSEIVQSELPPRREYAPTHPMANEEGFIYRPAVNSVEEIANMILFLASNESSFVTGSIIDIDGGQLAASGIPV